MTDKTVVGSSNPMVQLLRDWLKGCPNPPEWHWTFDLHVRTVNLLGNIPPENETNAVAVAGDSLTTTLADFEHRATHWLGEEQARANPNNALIALLCDAVRLARENESLARAPLKAFAGRSGLQGPGDEDQNSRPAPSAAVHLCAPHGKDWLTCPECAKAAGLGGEQA